MRYLPALLIGRLVRFAVRLVRRGGGSALPGLVVSKLAPKLVHKTINSFPKGLVVITGTAGKSTTTKMVVGIARAHGLEVFTNPSTANIEQGFFSTIIRYGNLFGKVPGDIAILEMDEGHAASFVAKVKPRISVILNVFEDQLDRFIDPALVREKLDIVAKATTESVLLNANDQNCLLISKSNITAKIDHFEINDAVTSSQVPMSYAKTYLPEISKPNASFEVIELQDRLIKIRVGTEEISFELPSRGIHFALDAVAAIAAAENILGTEFNLLTATKAMNEMPPVFSRGEIREVNGEPVEFILIQNPISTQLNLDNLPKDVDQVFLAIGRDVHDPSWLWTVDFSALKHVDIVSGFNYADAALALAYKGVEFDSVEADYFKAIDNFFALPKPSSGHKTVIYSADAMRRLRRYKGFTDPEDVNRV